MKQNPKVIIMPLLLALLIWSHGACSIKKMALKQVANALTSDEGGNVFVSDNDPELIADALPFAIKMYESLLLSLPNHTELRLKTGSMYVMYANAFLQAPAEILPDEQHSQKERLLQRAKNLYLRGRDIILTGLDTKYPGFLDALHGKDFEKAKTMAQGVDIEHLYWAGAGWLGAFALDPFDMKLGITVPQAAALMQRVEALNPNFNNGAIHDFYTLYYGALPDYMGGDPAKARDHFEKSIKITKGRMGSPFLSLATTVVIGEQNRSEFLSLLDKVLEIDPDQDPPNRLVHVINRRKALWLKEHVDLYFLEDSPEIEK